MMKLILDKALQDKYITIADKYALDNRAEVKRVEHAPFLVTMREAIKKNAGNIQNLKEAIRKNAVNVQNLNANMNSIGGSINQIKSGPRRKQKMENVVGLISAVIISYRLGLVVVSRMPLGKYLGKL